MSFHNPLRQKLGLNSEVLVLKAVDFIHQTSWRSAVILEPMNDRQAKGGGDGSLGEDGLIEEGMYLEP
jgi:hypothetical protein